MKELGGDTDRKWVVFHDMHVFSYRYLPEKFDVSWSHHQTSRTSKT